MAIVQVTLSFNSINVSAQVGDIAYYSFNAQPLGGFDTSMLQNVVEIGEIFSIDNNTITIKYDDTIVTAPPPTWGFISFAKNKKINTSSLLGY